MPYHTLQTRIEEKVQYAQGKQPKNGPRKVVDRRWIVQTEIVELPEKIDLKRAEADCFVLITNRPTQGADAKTSKELLQSYKAPDGIERNIKFMKDPLIVNDLFLKKPQRIEALGMILLLALLIWNLIQRQMRLHLAETKSTIEGLNQRQTDRPTSYAMTTKFRYILILRMNHKRILKNPLSSTQHAYLKALGLTEEIFIDPKPPQKKQRKK